MSPDRWASRPELLRGVSEWAAQELVVALSISQEAAETLLTRSLTLVHRLPGTLVALEAGALHPGHLWPMLEKVAPIDDVTVRAEVEAGLLRWAAGRVTTPAQLGAKARREVARRDARAAARRLEKAIARRGVYLRPDAPDGMASVTALLTAPEAQVLHRALGAYADAVETDPDAPPRTRAQKMADCLLDLVLRPGEVEAPPLQLLLTVVASVGTLAGGDEPGEIDAQVVPAEMVREFLRLLGSRSPSEPAPSDPQVEAPTAEVPELAWPQVEQDALDRWWVELEQRALAEELDPGPDPDPDPGPPVGTSAGLDLPSHVPPEPIPPDPIPPVPIPPDPAPAVVECGWWAAADRAVDDAGLALRRAEQSIAHARRVVRTATVADAADEAQWQAGPGRFTGADDALAVLRACTDAQREQLADLLSATGGGGLAERPRIALTDAVSGALLALTDLPGMRRAGTCGLPVCRREPARCAHDLTGRPGLGAPGPTDGYRPAEPLDRWVRARDRRCRFPGCRRKVPRGGELDHDRPYPLGATDAANLAGYCTGHHRGKHQAPGWRHELAADGTVTVTTPTGLTASTSPPPY